MFQSAVDGQYLAGLNYQMNHFCSCLPTVCCLSNLLFHASSRQLLLLNSCRQKIPGYYCMEAAAKGASFMMIGTKERFGCEVPAVGMLL